MDKWIVFKELVREKLESEEHRYALLQHQGIQTDNCAHKAAAFAEVLELLREVESSSGRCNGAAV